jgi:alkylated DNA repair dioxygenase AlkB
MHDAPQPNFFDVPVPLPDGFRYQPDLISPTEEQHLIQQIGPLPFQAFNFQGYTANRRTLSFGYRYDWDSRRLEPADPIPDFLLPLRDRAAAFANLPAPSLAHVLVSEYSPGSAIGWHKDKPAFAEVVGISLLSPCPFRLRRALPTGKWRRHTLTAAPRSAYLLSGPARTQWEHSIPPVDALRYSITFRTLAEGTPPSR